MKITLELYASLMKHLPPGSGMHDTTVEVTEQTTLNQLIDQFKIPRELAHIVQVNGFFKCAEDRDSPLLKEGDKVAIWPPVAGG